MMFAKPITTTFLLLAALAGCGPPTDDGGSAADGRLGVAPQAPAPAEALPGAQDVKPSALPAPTIVKPPEPTAEERAAKPKVVPLGIGLSPPPPYQLTFTATPDDQWNGVASTLTATTDVDLGQTAYFLRIRELATSTIVCETGFYKSCSVSVSKPGGNWLYRATIEDGPGKTIALDPGPPWRDVEVDWHGANVTLNASASTVAVGASVTLTATASEDITTSPFYLEIFDLTAGTRIIECPSGTTCSASVSQSVATTHAFRAFLSRNSATLPPDGLQSQSSVSYVTWASTGWSVTLAVTSSSIASHTLTATASAPVGPTPYYIHIYNEDGTRVGYCLTGSTCSVTVSVPTLAQDYVAFVAGAGSSLPPPNPQAASNIVHILPPPPPK